MTRAARAGRLALFACAASVGGCASDGDAATTATYAEVEEIVERSCAFSSCHGSTMDLGLDLVTPIEAGTSLRDVLVGVASCEVPGLQLVEPGAPERSWFYLKADPENAGADRVMKQSVIPPGAAGSGGDSAACPLLIDGEPYLGRLMPDSMQTLTTAELASLESWIRAGAPGPEAGASKP